MLALNEYQKNQLRHADTQLYANIYHEEVCLAPIVKFLDEQLIARLFSPLLAFILAITSAAHDLMNIGDQIIGGLITQDKEELSNAGISFIAFMIDGLALPLIGLIGLLRPIVAFQLAAKMNEIANLNFDTEIQENYSERALPSMCVIKGITEGVRDFSKNLKLTLIFFLGLATLADFYKGLIGMARSCTKPIKGLVTAWTLDENSLIELRLSKPICYEVL